jgi:hypothetical protein
LVATFAEQHSWFRQLTGLLSCYMKFSDPRCISKFLMNRNTLIGLLAALCLMGPKQGRCEDLVLPKLSGSFHFFQYQDGHVVSEELVRPGHPGYDTLRSLLSAHKAGWVIDVNTYAPSLYLKSIDMTINCRDDTVVVNFADKGSGRWRQLSNPLKGCKTAILKAMRLAELKSNG